MKKWSIIIGVMMAVLLLAMGSMSALAQTDGDVTVSSSPAIRDSLAIVAPRVAPVDMEISMTVFQCSDQKPVEGASVWLVTRDRLETLRQGMAEVKGNDSLSADSGDYESLLSVHGTLLGQTGEDGKLWHSFDNAGRYLLVAVMRGYFPAFRPIAVGMMPKALSIDAPRKAEIDERITITISQRGTEAPVKDVGVWALTREQAESLKADMASFRESGDQAAIEAAIGETVSISGIFLGTTNGVGKVHYAFENVGVYVLVAKKHGFFPAWKPIAVGMMPKALSIDAPRKAEIDERITITVFQRGTEEPVKDAGVWALTREQAEPLKAGMASVKESGDQATIEAAIEETVSISGIFLGTTNGAGKVHYAFENAGGCLMIAIKPGYFPGFRPIVIVPHPTADSLERLGP